MAYVQVHDNLRRNHKYLRLLALTLNPKLTQSENELLTEARLVRLWQAALDANREDGDLAHLDDLALAIVLGLEPNAAAGARYRAALREAGFLTPEGCIHDWSERTGSYTAKRASARKRQQRHRANDDEPSNEREEREAGPEKTADNWRNFPWDTTTDHDSGEPSDNGPWHPSWWPDDFDPHTLSHDDLWDITEMWRALHSADVREGWLPPREPPFAAIHVAIQAEELEAAANELDRRRIKKIPTPEALEAGRQMRAANPLSPVLLPPELRDEPLAQ
jgi:hypothetical protein